VRAASNEQAIRDLDKKKQTHEPELEGNRELTKALKKCGGKINTEV